MTITFTRPTEMVPCDDPAGECGWAHYAYSGPARYFIDGNEVSMEVAKAAYYRLGKKA